jgi:hypothetical protein
MIFYQGWGDGDAYSGAVIHYFREMVKTTFGGDYAAASGQTRVFTAPVIGHCSSGPGPNEWDKVAPPAHAKVDHERKLCPYAQQTVYTGPAGGQNDRRNWVASSFACKTK